MQRLEHLHRRVDQPFARSLGTAGAHDFIVALFIGAPRGNVADRTVRQLGDDRVRERRIQLDRQAQLRENLPGQLDPRDLVSQGDNLHFNTS
jgi:hypothetical protein